MKVYFETLGCPKNFYDTENAKGILEDAGFEICDSPETADFVVVNTCGFINDAKTESIERIFDMASTKRDDAKLVVSGCLSKRYSEELFEEMPEADAFVGVNEYEKLPDLLRRLSENPGERKVLCENGYDEVLKPLPRKLDENPYTATLKIAEGCDNVCAYCIIPFIRGGYRSKKMEDVVAEARALAEAGCRELILIAQDVTCYGLDLYGEYSLAKLLKKLCGIEGIRWIRLMYCYDDRITDELIETIATEEKICNYLDIPIQHASDAILSAMNRRSNKADLVAKLDKIRKAIPDIRIRTTLITGFPGETEKDHEELLEFVENQKFARLGVFAYSMEEGTAAGEMENQVDEDVKAQRLDEIMRIQREISLENNRRLIGETMEVMVDERDEDGSYIGRTRYDAPEIDNAVIFTSSRELKAGDIVNVKIEDAFDYDLTGEEC